MRFVTDALEENLPQALLFVEEQLDSYGCSKQTVNKIQIAVEEIFINVAQYAYGLDKGIVIIDMDYIKENSSVKITFTDSGRQYNPLLRKDPDVTLGANERKVGGLGIFMVKNSVDNVEYEYKNGHNCLTLTSEI